MPKNQTHWKLNSDKIILISGLPLYVSPLTFNILWTPFSFNFNGESMSMNLCDKSLFKINGGNIIFSGFESSLTF